MTLYWYKSQNPIEPYVFNDTAKALVGYKEEQDYKISSKFLVFMCIKLFTKYTL